MPLTAYLASIITAMLNLPGELFAAVVDRLHFAATVIPFPVAVIISLLGVLLTVAALRSKPARR